MKALQKRKSGVVTSDKMDKTAIVMVTRKVSHPLFKKIFTKRKKFKVHDEKNECSIGNQVLIEECRPVSREKRWSVVKVLVKMNEA